MEEGKKALEAIEPLVLKVPIMSNGPRKGELLDVLVDGDYDGEYISTLDLKAMSTKKRYSDYFNVVYRDSDYMKGSNTRYKYLRHLVMPKKKGFWVVHLNGNPLDCRSANLDYLTPSESAKLRDKRYGGSIMDRTALSPNGASKKQGGKSSTMYRGVHHNFRLKDGTRKYSVFITFKRNRLYRGSFTTAEEAARVYDLLAYYRWGDRASLNFPEEKEQRKLEMKQQKVEIIVKEKKRRYHRKIIDEFTDLPISPLERYRLRYPERYRLMNRNRYYQRTGQLDKVMPLPKLEDEVPKSSRLLEEESAERRRKSNLSSYYKRRAKKLREEMHEKRQKSNR